MTAEEKKNWAIAVLCQQAQALQRIPKKEDFDEATRSRIKAFLGPWPRALEAAGLKAARPNGKSRNKNKSGGRGLRRHHTSSAKAAHVREEKPI